MAQTVYFAGADATITVGGTVLQCTNWSVQEHGNQFSTFVTGSSGYDSVQGSSKYVEGTVDYLVPITSTTLPLGVNGTFTSASFAMAAPSGASGGGGLTISLTSGIVTNARINGATNNGVSISYTFRSNGPYTLPVA